MIDYTDPFRNDGEHGIVERNSCAIPDFKSIDPVAMKMAKSLGEKFSAMIADVARLKPESSVATPHPSICMLDLCVVMLSRCNYRIRDLYEAPADLQMAEYVLIATHIRRDMNMFPPHVALRFDMH